MGFHTNRSKVSFPNLTINNTIFERVVNVNFLRLLISSNAMWNCHVDYVSMKLSRAVGVINFSYYIVLPHFNLCLLLCWGRC